jgi:hypothetical protein
MFDDWLTGHVGNGQRDEQRSTHSPDRRGAGAYPNRPVAVRVEHTGTLRRHQERREQERPHGQNRGDLTDRPDERQAQRGHRTRIG